MKFDPTINFGTVIELAMFLVALVGGAIKIGRLEAKMDLMFTWFQDVVIHSPGKKKNFGD